MTGQQTGDDIPPWTDEDVWREEWEYDRLLHERPDSISRIQRNEESWD